MARPAVLMAEVEPLEGVSARKLVLETAKFNVITAHSAREVRELFPRFPNVSAAILHSSLADLKCEELAAWIKKTKPELPVIVLAPSRTYRCKTADHHVVSYEPEELLKLLRSLFGDPRAEDGK